MNLIFFPSDFKLEYIKPYVQELIDSFNITKQKYKLFNYNKYTVEQVNNLNMCRSHGLNLLVPLNFIKGYCNNDINYNIYIFTTGYSDNQINIDINDYILPNINKFVYLEKKINLYYDINDFKHEWLNNKKFIYLSLK